MVTQRQIAEKLGLSQQTVSLCFSRPASVAGQTLDRVRQKAKEMGYRVNVSARAMRQGRFNAAAMLLSTERGRSSLPSALLDGVEEALARHGIHLTLFRLDDRKLTDESFVPRILREWMADGLLVNYNKHVPARMIELIEQYHVPAVWINSKRTADCVYPDDFGAARDATRHLISCGHRRIAFVALESPPHRAPHYSQVDRRRGYERAMAEARLTPVVLPDRCGLTPAQQITQAQEWLRRHHPTAVLAYSRNCAMPVYAAAADAGLAVPRQLSIVTFLTDASELPLPFALLSLPQHSLGSQAVEMLLKKIARPDRHIRPRRVSFEFKQMEFCLPPLT